MSSTKSEQTILTYLANKGSYNATTINFDLHLPSPKGFTYEFGPAFNISKNIGGTKGKVNAICLFMKKNRDNDILLESTANTDHTFNINTSTLIHFVNDKAISFDDQKETACIIVIHNHIFSLDLIEGCFHNLENHIDGLTPINSPKILTSAEGILTPRKLGVSIITKYAS